MPRSHVLDDAPDQRIPRNKTKPDIQQFLHIWLDEGLRFHRCQQFRCVNRFTVVADATRLLGEVGGLVGISRTDNRPPINEDLRADLLGHGLAIYFGPTLEGAAEIAANDFAEPTGIDAFGIVVRNFGHASLPWLAGQADERFRISNLSSRLLPGCSSPPGCSRPRRVWAANAPRSNSGCRTVVRPSSFAAGMASNPAMAMSSGTDRPAARAPPIPPPPSLSFPPQTAGPPPPL